MSYDYSRKVMESVFFHADIDAFFAQVEKLDNSELRDKPVIVGGSMSRSVVSTCSYEARAFGVHSGMPIAQAKKLCPAGVFVPVRMKRYHEKSVEVMSILQSYTPHFQQLSIDEGFLDMTGTKLLLGEPEKVAEKLKAEILEKTKLTISIGIASTKYFAKLASDFKKPNGLFYIHKSDELSFIQSLPMNKIWGIGKMTVKKLEAAGIMNTKTLSRLSCQQMQLILGTANGLFLYDIINAHTEHIFNETVRDHSVSTEMTFETDVANTNVIENFLFELSSELSYRLIREQVASSTLSVKIKYADFKTVTIQEANSVILDTVSIFNEAKKLFYKKWERGNPVRLIGIAALKVLDNEANTQGELFSEPNRNKKQKLVEKTALDLAKKQGGKQVLTRARLINTKETD